MCHSVCLAEFYMKKLTFTMNMARYRVSPCGTMDVKPSFSWQRSCSVNTVKSYWSAIFKNWKVSNDVCSNSWQRALYSWNWMKSKDIITFQRLQNLESDMLHWWDGWSDHTVGSRSIQPPDVFPLIPIVKKSCNIERCCKQYASNYSKYDGFSMFWAWTKHVLRDYSIRSASINLHMGPKFPKVFNPLIPWMHNYFKLPTVWAD